MAISLQLISGFKKWIFCFFIIPGVLTFFIGCNGKKKYDQWSVYGGSKERIQYSTLHEIDTSNVKNLQVAWVYNTKDAEASSQIQTNPLIVDDVLYGVSPRLKLFAADAASGREIWVFDPIETMLLDNAGKQVTGMNACRGVALYKGQNKEHLIFYTAGSSLYCINSLSGKLVLTFGKQGRIDLHENLDVERDVKNLRVTSTTPGIIYKDLIIVGSSLSEDEEAAPGHIRAYDVHTGQMKWMFRTIPKPGEIGYETWEDPEAYKYVGGANSWGGFSLDEKRGVVYASTGTSNPDFYGGKRKGDNLFANSVIALDAGSGKHIWHFQTIHHDVWDYDLPTAPILVTVKKDGKAVDAVVQLSKQGFIYMLDRETGKPVHPIIEKPVPTSSDLTGEQLSPTQPFPTVLPPFVRQKFTEADLNKHIPDSSYQDIKHRFATYRNGEMFTPPGKQGTIVTPGLSGGAEWGGPSFDPETGVLYVNANEAPYILTMSDIDDNELPKPNQTNLEAGKVLYSKNCGGCHGSDMKGSGSFPSLVALDKKYNETTFKSLVSSGIRMMPAFKNLTEGDKTAIASYLLNDKLKQKEKFIESTKTIHPFYKVRYRFGGYKHFVTKEGYPAISPPWGTLSAIDLSSEKIVWKNTLGGYPELKARGIHSGIMNFGGSVTTAGGLVFIAATKDGMFRAFNKVTGELLFETALPAAGYATPSVYSIKGKQYVVIACGGGKGTKSGDSYVAFSLPDKKL